MGYGSHESNGSHHSEVHSKKDPDRRPLALVHEWVHCESLAGDLIILVHLLGKLEIEECDFISSEVRGQSDLDVPATILNAPFWVMVFLVCPFTNSLNESLSLLKRVKLESPS
jgi:hypothetical protein